MVEIENPTTLINKDYESIELVTFSEWIEDFERLANLGVGLILEPGGYSTTASKTCSKYLAKTLQSG